MKAKITPVGGNGLFIELCRAIDLECNRQVHGLYYSLSKVKGVLEAVPGYGSLLVIYDPLTTSFEELKAEVESLDIEAVKREPKLFRVPVVYGGEYGPDLKMVAERTGLSEDEVVEIHTSRTYTCYMLGFTPGFVYLGDVDDRIAVPRLPTPRVKIPAGSVGIAGKQTGWYGVESPGGWVLIGRTPMKTFDPHKDPPTFIRPGDKVQFYKITKEEYRRWKG